MYEYIKGSISELTPTFVVVEAASVGYFINISLNSYSDLEGKTDGKLFIEEVIREDAHLLYGFTDKQERTLFRHLISVSGVGANTASMILSTFTVAELENVISSGDVNAIKKVKGIGLKTAQKLLIDLKDKITPSTSSALSCGSSRNTDRLDAINALVLLGYQQSDSTKLVDQILSADPTMPLEKIVKEALRLGMKK